VLAHDGLDSFRRLLSVVEGDGADKVVKNVSVNDSVEEMATDETELAVNGSSGTSGEVPG